MLIKGTIKRHPYHLVELSPWPLYMALSVMIFGIGVINILVFQRYSMVLLGLSLILVIFILWWRDVIRESVGGKHTKLVQKGITIGFLLFLISEIMLFFSLFWGFFHSSLSPAIELGGIWPPTGIRSIDPWSIPLLGSLLLVSSGFTVTLAHHSTRYGNKDLTIIGFILTILLGLLFVFFQMQEYSLSEYTITDSVFGSIFYLTTGLHGLHVIIGVIFLIIVLIRLIFDQLTIEHHLGLEFAIYYWHLVDLVWFFVFISFYWWGS